MLTLNFDPFPVITTERLVLRNIRLTDAADYFWLRSHPGTTRDIPRRPVAQTVEDTAEQIQRILAGIANKENITWAVTLQGEDHLMGTLSYVHIQSEYYRAEMRFMLHPDLQSKGIMQEAITAVLDYGFHEMKLHSIETLIDPDNKSLEKVLKKNKFVQEASFRENEFYEGRFLDTIVYTLLERYRYA